MSADATQLSEVVVVGYGLADKEDNDETFPVHIANPVGGRRAYNKYLEKSLRYPEIAIQNKVEGKVTVQFIIDLSGKLTDFAIIRGLGFGCDEEVIRLVKEGPKWNPSIQAEIPIESTVRVRVKFKLPK
jgi:TonB family protein